MQVLEKLYKTVPAAIRMHRERLGLTIEKAAIACHLSKGVYAEAEAGHRRGKPSLPSIITLAKIAAGFRIPMHVLLEENAGIVHHEHDLAECSRRVAAHFQPPTKEQIEAARKAALAALNPADPEGRAKG